MILDNMHASSDPIADCKQPPPLTHGTFAIPNGTLDGDTAIYSCDAYSFQFPDGTPEIEVKCLDTGRWEPVNIPCIGKH